MAIIRQFVYRLFNYVYAALENDIYLSIVTTHAYMKHIEFASRVRGENNKSVINYRI